MICSRCGESGAIWWRDRELEDPVVFVILRLCVDCVVLWTQRRGEVPVPESKSCSESCSESG